MRLVLRDVIRTLQGLTRTFELHTPCFEVAQGEVVALIGESGSGKTAMLELLALAANPDPGGVFRIEGPQPVDIAALWRDKRFAALAATRAERLGFVAQAGGLLPFLSARANAALAQKVAGRSDPDRIERLAERLGVAEVLDERPARLSIGQRQRAAIVRALSHRPNFVIADEPTSSLDPGAAEEAMNLFLSAAAEEGAGVILASHNVRLMRRAGAEIVEVVSESSWKRRTQPAESTDSKNDPENASPSFGPVLSETAAQPHGGGSRPSPQAVGISQRADAPNRWVSRVERVV